MHVGTRGRVMDMTFDMPHRSHCLRTCAVQVALCRLPSALISASHTLFPGSWLVQIRKPAAPQAFALQSFVQVSAQSPS